MNSRKLVIALLAGVSLAACQKSSLDTPPLAALPASTGSASPLAEAPPTTALPPAPPPRLASVSDPRQAYAYADQAWAMSDALGDSPPDYTYVDDGVTPWVWVADDGAECIAEAVPGGERYYYYQPGADEPYYVQDADYGYGFDDGALVVVFDGAGRELPPGAFQARADFAGRVLARGQSLRTGASSAQHQPVAAGNWNARRGVIAQQRQTWSRQVASNPDWRAYHDQNGAQELAHWSNESARRETWAAQTDARLGDAARAGREQQLAAARRPPAFGAQPPLAAPAARQQQLARNEPSRLGAGRTAPSSLPAAVPSAAPTRREGVRQETQPGAFAPAAGVTPPQRAPRSSASFAERRTIAPQPREQRFAPAETRAVRAVQTPTPLVRSRQIQAFAAPPSRAPPEARAAAAAASPAAARAPVSRPAAEPQQRKEEPPPKR